MAIEVTPGMFSSKEVKPSMKAGLVMAAFTLLTLYTFGFAGNAAIVTFQLSDKGHALSVPDFAVSSSAFAILVGGLMGVITLVATALTILKRVVPMWLSLIFGLLWISTLLGWLAAGNVVPVSFILSNAVVLAVPIILGALGGVISERVGVVNIAIEGQLLTGAFVASVIGSVTDNLWLGVAAAAIASAILSMALASLAIKYLVDQIIIGVLINLLVIGVTNFLYSQWLANDGQNVNYPGTFDVLSIPILSEIPIIGQALFANRVTVYLCFVLVPLVWFMLFKTKLGLRARAVGEHPLAADTVGINVARTRFWWVTTGGAIAGIGGAFDRKRRCVWSRNVWWTGLHRARRGYFGSLAAVLRLGSCAAVRLRHHHARLGQPGEPGHPDRLHHHGALPGNPHCRHGIRRQGSTAGGIRAALYQGLVEVSSDQAFCFLIARPVMAKAMQTGASAAMFSPRNAPAAKMLPLTAPPKAPANIIVESLTP